MLEELGSLPAPVLGLEEYKEDFRRHFWVADVTWRLERGLTFREPGSPSWVAMRGGDWDGALRLAEGMRAGRVEHQRALDRRGIVQRRVRFVCEPLTAYLQWELHVLTIWAELGEQITVLPTAAVAHLEAREELPEVLILGERVASPVMYVIQYSAGVLSGARRFVDRELIEVCRREVAALWRCGEDILRYFPRRIESLPPPDVREE
ncbi:hypothetical protein GCM10009677_42190 [Sphaerisporangium rubeum]|uniref:DUF6879 domain-containing protein n=1 Tax=Sphaerisporangium rubeum TaxID=321317 RepID=A0A7X0ICS1_9ACTN|nr:DUF6879 family protein [Sphaerisporangium rubeum]MBB6471583.1 hypothetical protein [Sphaerisporangium rubeum]